MQISSYFSAVRIRFIKRLKKVIMLCYTKKKQSEKGIYVSNIINSSVHRHYHFGSGAYLYLFSKCIQSSEYINNDGDRPVIEFCRVSI